MATIKPFRATRYSHTSAQNVAPPYDVISPDQRAALIQRGEHNIVQLTLPEGGEERYQRAARQLNDWLQAGILTTDNALAIYRYTQRFLNPLDGSTATRVGYFVLLHTEPYESGVVLPHEHTFPGVKEDRFRLVEAARTHLETIFGLYEPSWELNGALGMAAYERVAELEGSELPEGHYHCLERATDPDALQKIIAAFQSTRIWIADGHHRYETALRFGMQYGSEGSPERFLPVLLVPLDDPGLVILPTHRMMRQGLSGGPADWDRALSAHFELRPLTENERSSPLNGESVVLYAQGGYWAIRPRSYEPAAADEPVELKRLDSYWLHKHVLPALGYDKPEIDYTRSMEEAVKSVQAGNHGAAFLLSPPQLSDLQAIAQAGGKMPHKSTYFHPKVLSGMVTWRIE